MRRRLRLLAALLLLVGVGGVYIQTRLAIHEGSRLADVFRVMGQPREIVHIENGDVILCYNGLSLEGSDLVFLSFRRVWLVKNRSHTLKLAWF